MTNEILPPLIWAAVGAAAFIGIDTLHRYLAERRRRKAKPWRKSAEPPKLPVAHQQKTVSSLGKASVRKSKARIGAHRRLNR